MAKDPAYRDAVEQLRRFTKSGPGRSPFSILLRATALSRAARAVLVNSDLRTRSERRAAIVTAAAAITAAAAETKEATE